MALSGKTNYAEGIAVQWLWTVDAVTRPTQWFVALFTTTPTSDDGTGGTEATGGSYARTAVTFADAASQVQPTADVEFPTATAGWGTINGFGVYDNATTGNLLAANDVTTPKDVGNGDRAKFATTDLTISED